MDDRERRAARLRPLVQKKVQQTRSRRQAAREIGVSDMALKRYLEGETPYEPTLDLYARWVSGGDTSDDPSEGGGNPQRLEDALIDLLAQAKGAEPWVQLEILREIGAVKRAIAAEHDSRAAERRAEAQLEDARASGQRLAALAGEAADGRWRRMAMEAIRTGKVPREAVRGIEIPLEEPAKTTE